MRRLAQTIEVMNAEVAEVLDPSAQLRPGFALHGRSYSSCSSGLMSFGLCVTTKVTQPWVISSCATRHAFMDLVAIRGCAPDCSWRARRAAPFTRLYLL